MKIGLYNVDNKKFPNFALMKIANYHKLNRDSVENYLPIMHQSYDKIYASSVFSYSDKSYISSDMICGGSGFSIQSKLPEDIENTEPDYSFYNLDYALGFLTRGCIRNCNFCLVREKEGYLQPYRDIEQVIQDKNKVVLMDNNILASDYGIKQIEKIIKMGIKIDFNQGLDARLIDNNIAKLLSQVKWLKPLRMACDNKNMLPYVTKATELLRKYNCTPSNYFIYMLIEDEMEAADRAISLDYLKLDPFAQPKLNLETGEICGSKELKNVARWINHKAIFRSCTYEEYKNRVYIKSKVEYVKIEFKEKNN